MGRRLGRLAAALAVLAVAPTAPALAVEEIVRMETRVVDCQNMLPGSMGCQQYLHMYTTTNPNETRAGRTFQVYTKAEIDERLRRIKASALGPAIEALAEEIAQLRRAVAEMGSTCGETVSGSRAPARPAAAR
jgi:hypothetical protein